MQAKKTQQGGFDIVLVNGSSAAVVEVKFKVQPSAKAKAAKNLKRYRKLYPEQKNFKLCGEIAGFSVSMNDLSAAKKQGLFVLERVGTLLKTEAKAMQAFT